MTDTLWAELSHCHALWGSIGVIGGDFNMVLRRCERSRTQFSEQISQELKECIVSLDLEDLPLCGGQRT